MNLTAQKKQLRFTLGLLKKRPFSVLLQVTNRCNMKCSFCDFWPNGADPSEEITIKEYQDLAKNLSQLGCFLVSIEGGEPFVRKDLIEIVKAFSSHHLPILYTNGWYVTPESAKALFDAGLHQVGVSIDFSDPARHDSKRGLLAAFQKAWKAVEYFRDAAENGKRQVHVMSVLMEENQQDLEKLLQLSQSYQVGHCITLLSTQGFRRGQHQDQWPSPPISEWLLKLWKKYPHLIVFQDYLKEIDSFLNQKNLPTCRAGQQSFNIDHLGNVSPCIEKIDWIMGNIRQESLLTIHQKMQNLTQVEQCQDCWTLCRGFSQIMGSGGSLKGWKDMSTRMRGA